MKNTLIKSLSIFLALVLILTASPIAVFSAESEKHMDTDSCGQYALICEHVYTASEMSISEPYSETHHKTTEYVLETCNRCGITVRNETSSYLSEHIVETWVLVDQYDNVCEYKGTCKYCGEELSLTIEC